MVSKIIQMWDISLYFYLFKGSTLQSPLGIFEVFQHPHDGGPLLS